MIATTICAALTRSALECAPVSYEYLDINRQIDGWNSKTVKNVGVTTASGAERAGGQAQTADGTAQAERPHHVH